MELTQEHFDEGINGLATKQDLDGLATKVGGIETRMDGLATKADLSSLATKVDELPTKDYLKDFAQKSDLKNLATKEDVKEAVREGYEDLARIVAEGFRGVDERAREHREAMIELQGKMNQLVDTVKEVVEMHSESMEAIKELSVGHHNHEVRITRIEQGRRGFQARVA